MDVLEAAHAQHQHDHAGRDEVAGPRPASPADPAGSSEVWCGRCGIEGVRAEYQRATTVISPNFTAADQWRRPSSPWLCPVCTWGYRTNALRLRPHLVQRSPASSQPLDLTDVCQILLGGSLPHDVALTVPLKPGRKHLLPEARWGVVTTDDTHLPWTDEDATRLHTTVQLRGRGFGTRMLTAPAPAWAVLRRLPAAHQAQVATDWRHLDVWRARRPWLALALHITANSTRKENR